MENNEKRSLREDWRLIKRAFGIWNEIAPHYWFSQILCVFANAFIPYFGIYMSAALVTELGGDCNPKRLAILAAVTVIGSFLLNYVNRVIHLRKDLDVNGFWYAHHAFLQDHQNQMQFEHFENPDVLLRKQEITTWFASFGGGLLKVQWCIPDLLDAILNIIFSAALTFSMFRMRTDGYNRGWFGLINSPFSGVIILLLIAVNAFFSIKISTTRSQKVSEALNDVAEYNTWLNAYFRGAKGGFAIDDIIFGMNRIFLNEYKRYHLHPKWAKDSSDINRHYGMLSILLNAAVNIAIFLFVAAKVYIGVFGLGSFLLYQATIVRFVSAVSSFASEFGNLRFNNQYLIKVYEFLDLPNEMYKGTLAVEKRDDIDYEIEFRDVSFKYPRTETWALRHVNMKFKIGDKLAIVGENGSGKTTFIKLLCRLYDPTEGKILLNGIDITRYRYDEYMALFSVVFQDYALFQFPLAANVAASFDWDAERVRDCLVRAGMEDKLDGLERGIETPIGRDYDSEGVDFSGGEMQKIALARALYKDAPFVILDEPTAALDPIAEAAVYENFNTLTQNKTSVFISHRLSSCRFCDKIAVFDHGMLVQEGTHEALVGEAGGKYAELWHAQAKYYEGEVSESVKA